MAKNTAPTFIQAAYRNFNDLQELCLQYHCQRHGEELGDPFAPMLTHCEQVRDRSRLLYKYYVEGTLVLVRAVDTKTGNQTLYTTNGHNWYSNHLAQGVGQLAPDGQKRKKAACPA